MVWEPQEVHCQLCMMCRGLLLFGSSLAVQELSVALMFAFIMLSTGLCGHNCAVRALARLQHLFVRPQKVDD